MIYVDYRAGSKDLIKPLRKVIGESEVEETDLKFADIFFEGRGIGGKSLDIGIEYKKLGEMLTSCRDGRFAGHQLPGLTGPKKHYDYAWLLVEGAWRADESGYVATYKGPRLGWQAVAGKMRASEYEKHLLTFAICGAIQVGSTDSQQSSIRFITNLYRWWTDSDLDKHTSHLAVHQPSMLAPIPDEQAALMAWPGVGRVVSKAALKAFGSVENAATAGAPAWALLDIDGKKFGEEKARKLVDFLRRRV